MIWIGRRESTRFQLHRILKAVTSLQKLRENVEDTYQNASRIIGEVLMNNGEVTIRETGNREQTGEASRAEQGQGSFIVNVRM